jgi:hypothetical protein
VHLGVGAASFGNVCVGLYGLWHNMENSKAFDQIACDFGLLVSNDGMHFREPVKGHRFLRRDESLVTPVPGREFNTVLCQANGILNVGDETRIYHGRWRNVGGHTEEDADKVLRHYYGEVALATLPRDRWAAFGLYAGANEGVVCSAPMKLPQNGGAITINADCNTGIMVDMLDTRFQPIAGFTNGSVKEANGLDCMVEWTGHALSELDGQEVRVQLRMRRMDDQSPRLYAIYLN